MTGGTKKGKEKQKEKEDSSSWRGPWCLLLQGERAIPVLQYLTDMAPDIIDTSPPPGESTSTVTGMLIDPAKETIFRIVCMVFRELEGGLCFTSMAHTNIFVTPDGIVKIRNGNVLRSVTDKLAKENVNAAANLIDELVAAASPTYSNDRSVNPELRHLIKLMRGYTPGRSTYLMKYHPSTVPVANRGVYVIILHDETMGVLRYNDPEAFQFVVDGVDVAADWYPRMQANTILRRYLIRGGYDPTALVKKNVVPKLVPIKCVRNIPSHGREDAGDARGPYFTRADLARSVYDKVPMLACTMAKGLDAAGELKKLKLDDLFPGRIKFEKKST